jgi:uncharacterized protein
MKGKEETTVRKLIQVFVAFLLINILCADVCHVYGENNYRVVIEDGEDLLSSEEENALAVQMDAITKYGNAGFVSVSQYDSTASYAKEKYRQLFGHESGILFVIDMGRRNIWIYCDGKIYRTIDKAYANTITDNVYRYATRGEYYECAANVYDQARLLLEGGHIAQPMKHVSNALIALVLALLLNFVLLLLQRKEKNISYKEIAAAMTTATAVKILSKKKTKSKRHIHVESDSSSGGGYSGGGGGGGGGSSGGGGGHSF